MADKRIVRRGSKDALLWICVSFDGGRTVRYVVGLEDVILADRSPRGLSPVSYCTASTCRGTSSLAAGVQATSDLCNGLRQAGLRPSVHLRPTIDSRPAAAPLTTNYLCPVACGTSIRALGGYARLP